MRERCNASFSSRLTSCSSHFKSSYEDENNLGQFVGEVRTVFKSELDKQVTKEARADKDSRIHNGGANKKLGNGDADEDNDDEDNDGGDKVTI